MLHTPATRPFARPLSIWQLLSRLLAWGRNSCTLLLAFISVSGPPSSLSVQSRQNLIPVKSLKGGGFRLPGSKRRLNPNEKAPQANCWTAGSWTVPGTHCLSLFVLGNTVLSLCGGSGSLMEICMRIGRSCIMFEKDGLFPFLIIPSRETIWRGGHPNEVCL